MPKKSEKRLLVEKYCSIDSYRKLTDSQLAHEIYDNNSNKFKDFENARTTVRLVRGHIGKDIYKRCDSTYYIPTTSQTPAKILIIDIETAPIRAYVWGIWNQNIGTQMIDSDWFCLTWSAKWLFEDKIYSGKLTSKEAIKQDDKRIIKGIWGLLNEADIVIAHNGKKFDIPKLNQKFLIYKLNPPLPYQLIDTLDHIRKQFKFTSNKLDYVNQVLNLTRKTEHEGFPLWEKCYKGDAKALNTMLEYNIGDVKILEETYLNIRAWIKPHPNLGLFILDELERCPTCGSDDLIEEGKDYHTTVNIFPSLRCKNCGASGRRRLSKLTVTEKRTVLVSLPK